VRPVHVYPAQQEQRAGDADRIGRVRPIEGNGSLLAQRDQCSTSSPSDIDFSASWIRRRGEDEACHLLRLVDLNVVPGTGKQKQLRGREQAMELPGHSLVQVGVGIAKDDPNGSGGPPLMRWVARHPRSDRTLWRCNLPR
jgi:hypothetical protein